MLHLCNPVPQWSSDGDASRLYVSYTPVPAQQAVAPPAHRPSPMLACIMPFALRRQDRMACRPDEHPCCEASFGPATLPFVLSSTLHTVTCTPKVDRTGRASAYSVGRNGDRRSIHTLGLPACLLRACAWLPTQAWRSRGNERVGFDHWRAREPETRKRRF